MAFLAGLIGGYAVGYSICARVTIRRLRALTFVADPSLPNGVVVAKHGGRVVGRITGIGP